MKWRLPAATLWNKLQAASYWTCLRLPRHKMNVNVVTCVRLCALPLSIPEISPTCAQSSVCRIQNTSCHSAMALFQQWKCALRCLMRGSSPAPRTRNSSARRHTSVSKQDQMQNLRLPKLRSLSMFNHCHAPLSCLRYCFVSGSLLIT